MDTITLDDVRGAVDQLARSGRGRNAMRHLLAWLDRDGLSLDEANQEAVLTILSAAWGPWAGSARDFMRTIVGGE